MGLMGKEGFNAISNTTISDCHRPTVLWKCYKEVGTSSICKHNNQCVTKLNSNTCRVFQGTTTSRSDNGGSDDVMRDFIF